jgi:histidinol-phosphate aminotransferase
MVVVDEAYIDFSYGEGMLSLVPEKRNLVVLQTLSKAWGLAGIRLGMVFAHPELITYLSKVKYPYNIKSLSLKEALKQIRISGRKEEWIDTIHKERDRLVIALDSLAFVEEVYPSDANFLLVRMKDPAVVYSFLRERGIVVRDRSKVPLCEGCLRITVGTTGENRKLCDALVDYGKTKEN